MIVIHNSSVRRAYVFATVLLLSDVSLHAQHGCIHSPEAPTGVLMLVGSVGMIYGSSWLRKVVGNWRDRR
jgi:XrtJ-associated TM-motif-TM protein